MTAASERQPGGLQFSRRLRRTPFTARAEACGVHGFSVVNHMLLPKAYQNTVEEDYWHLREHAQIWDVACQRQVELRGADAARLAQWMTPRNLARAKTGDCLYAPLVDHDGGIINDPVLLKLADDHFRFSIADSDVLLWACGLAAGAGMQVDIYEPDVSPLAVQGPRAEEVIAALFGDAVRELRFFKFARFSFMGAMHIVARSGYSRQGGFEIYLEGEHRGSALWDALSEAGRAFQLRPGCPNLIERIESGLLSYGNEMTRANNPLECGLDTFCDLDGELSHRECLGLEALRAIRAAGVSRKIRGLRFDAPPCPPCAEPWRVTLKNSDALIGQVTSAAYSPRLRANVALAMMEGDGRTVGCRVHVHAADGQLRNGKVVALPFA
ncbi:MAG: dimethylsulfoniopropionate demethylase [Alphaproteobacteria bacterium]|nr:dimethylsulfoniopropionate demethylase [Alphaproteobacteria bacterium]MDA8030343.1 dimethylsulfoniopropionate demethylase [Alphaproteobacteria bacterium]